jgi:hypothetical protein
MSRWWLWMTDHAGAPVPASVIGAGWICPIDQPIVKGIDWTADITGLPRDDSRSAAHRREHSDSRKRHCRCGKPSNDPKRGWQPELSHGGNVATKVHHQPHDRDGDDAVKEPSKNYFYKFICVTHEIFLVNHVYPGKLCNSNFHEIYLFSDSMRSSLKRQPSFPFDRIFHSMRLSHAALWLLSSLQ